MSSLWASLLLSALAGPPAAPAPLLDDVGLRDARGTVRRLDEWRHHKLLVVVFLGVDCPLAKRYAPRLADLLREFGPRGVGFVAVDANECDSLEAIAHFRHETGLTFPFLKDPGNRLADRLGATRTAEVFLLDERRAVRYHGRIDDQDGPGVHRLAPTRRDLAEAIGELLDGRPVSRPETCAPGCVIDRERRPADTGEVTYCRHIAPVLFRHCVSCHRPGQIGPFSLLTYRDAADWSETIGEVVRERRMPPWGADPRYGHFANDPSLTDEERRLLDAWVAQGTPRGDPTDLPPPPTFSSAWGIPGPDLVVPIPAPFTVPARGVVPYQYFEVDPGFREDHWVRAAEIRPGNRAVVHHCNVFLKPPGSAGIATVGMLESQCLAVAAPGTPPLRLPAGMAMRVPAGWHFLFQVHYTPAGTVQTDRTSLGLAFADPAQVKREAALRILTAPDLCIPPHDANYRVERSQRFDQDVLLLALFPHMHLRGKAFRYEALYPDGRTETLLEVPRYDFNWQLRYELAEPKRLPAGTTLRCTAWYDNSAANPSNPDPEATVREGEQIWDEMFRAHFEVAPAAEGVPGRAPGDTLYRALHRVGQPLPALILVALCGLFLAFGRWRSFRRLSAGRGKPGASAP
jgi:peroxiredoxin/mono/diheme cytochrome c family protein